MRSTDRMDLALSEGLLNPPQREPKPEPAERTVTKACRVRPRGALDYNQERIVRGLLRHVRAGRLRVWFAGQSIFVDVPRSVGIDPVKRRVSWERAAAMVAELDALVEVAKEAV